MKEICHSTYFPHHTRGIFRNKVWGRGEGEVGAEGKKVENILAELPLFIQLPPHLLNSSGEVCPLCTP